MSRYRHSFNLEGLCESIECYLEYTPAEPATLEYPGADARMEFQCATLLGNDISLALTDETVQAIEYAAIVAFSEKR